MGNKSDFIRVVLLPMLTINVTSILLERSSSQNHSRVKSRIHLLWMDFTALTWPVTTRWDRYAKKHTFY